MQGLTGIFQSKNELNNDKTETYVANFTPLNFVVKDGIATTSEMWLTSEDLAAGFQGKADLNTKKINAVMGILGASFTINDPALRYAFRPQQIYDVPITVNINKPNIKWDVLAINVTGTVISQQAEQHGGDVGNAISGLLGAIGKSTNEERRQKSGFSWNMPPAAQDLVKRADAQIGDRRNAPQPEEQGTEREEQPRRRKNNLGNLLNDLFN